MKESDGWAVKNKWGSILFWTLGKTRREVIKNIGGLKRYHYFWKADGHEIIKIKVVER